MPSKQTFFGELTYTKKIKIERFNDTKNRKTPIRITQKYKSPKASAAKPHSGQNHPVATRDSPLLNARLRNSGALHCHVVIVGGQSGVIVELIEPSQERI